MTTTAGRANVLVVYKNLLKLASTLPADKRTESVALIKDEFRKHVNAVDPSTIEKLLGKANSTLGYLKIVTPRGARQATPQQGVTRITFGPSGAEVARPGKAVSNWSGSNVDPDSLKRHQRSLTRAGFKGHRDAKGIF